MARNDEDERSAIVIEERRRLVARGDHESFDRLAFARRALRILNPRAMTIGIYEGRHDVRVERGRDWSQIARGESDATWAMVSIPRYATRHHIALALAEVAGVAHLPYVVDVLVAAARVD